MIRQKLPPTFPLRLVLVVSVVMCLCGTGTIILAILSVKHQTWGYNWGTGFWCGAITLAAGVCGIVASHARETCSMKLFMIFAVFGGVTSLVMLALSAGGLDTDSGMYSDTYKAKHMTLIVHAGCLGLSVIQLIIFILADGICIYYLLVEQRSTLFSLKTTPGNKPIPISHRKRSKHGKSKNNTLTPIFQKPKSKRKLKKAKNKGTYQTDDIDDLETPLRNVQDTLLTQSRVDFLFTASPVRDHSNRNSFTTFGRSSIVEQESLIVHPDEDVFTLRSESRVSNCDGGHYAQGVLFEAPLPIEEDEELPPYEAVDTSPYRVAIIPSSLETPNNPSRRSKSYRRKQDTDTVLTSNELTRSGETFGDHSGRINTRNEIPHGRGESDTPPKWRRTTVSPNMTPGEEPVYAVVQPRRSRSADLLSEEIDVGTVDRQGVILKDLAYSSDKISPRAQRTQSLRTQRPNREKRLERRHRALSMEMKNSNKDEMSVVPERQNIIKRTASIDSSNSGLFADNRVMPTKFSLRTPVRQVGTPYMPSVMPVKSISSLPMFQPPPKPPRTHSVTSKDLQASFWDNTFDNVNALECVDPVSIGRNVSNYDISNAKNIANELPLKNELKEVDKLENETSSAYCVHDVESVKHEKTKNQTQSVFDLANNIEVSHQMNSEMKVQDSPMIKCFTGAVSDTCSPTCQNDTDLNMATKATNGHSNNDLDIQDSMTIPSSPILKQVAVECSTVKKDDKNAMPIPKVRTSIQAVRNNHKQKAANNENDSEDKNIFTDSISNDKTDETDIIKQGQITHHDFSILRVNLPPLKPLSTGSASPSLKILNRKFPKKEPDMTGTESHEVTNSMAEKLNMSIADSPTITVSRSHSVEYKGARPKTTPRTPSSMNIKPNFTVSSSTKNTKPSASPFVKKSETRKSETLLADFGVRPKQFKSVQSAQKKTTIQKPLPTTRIYESGAKRPVISIRNSSNISSAPSASVHTACSPAVTQSVAPSAAGAPGYPQGVLRLPQSQYSRHVSSMEVQQSRGNGGNNNVPVNMQNSANQQNANTDNLLISKFL